MIKRYLHLLVVLFFCNGVANAQELHQPVNATLSIEHSCLDQLNEMVYIHLSRSSIVAGDHLLFKAYIFNKNNKKSVNSKILYMQIVDCKGTIYANARAAIKNGVCESSINIPDSLYSGKYKLVAYTNFMRNLPVSTFPSTFFIVVGQKYEPEIMVANDKIETSSVSQAGYSVDSNSVNKFYIQEPSRKNVKVNLNKKTFGKGEKAILSISLSDNNGKPIKGNFSISVSEKLPDVCAIQPPDIVMSVNSFIKNTSRVSDTTIRLTDNLSIANNAYMRWYNQWMPNELNILKYKPENVDYLLEGLVIDKLTGKPLAGERILLSSPDSMAILKYRFSDSLGRFSFPLDNSFNNRKLLLSLYPGKEPKEIAFIFDNKWISDSSFCFNTIKTGKVLNEYYFKCKKLALFNKVFDKDSENSKPAIIQNVSRRFYGKPDYSVYMSDYLVEFEDFNDICKNTLPGVRLKKRGNKKSIEMIDLKLQLAWKRNCFILLDNVPFYDIDFISKLGSQQINYIEVNYRHLAYGDIDFYGMLSIFTKDKLMLLYGRSIILENNVEPENSNTLNTVAATGISKKPNFKQLLYWAPSIALNSDEQKVFEFYTSSLASNYIIDIEGIADNNEPISYKMEFKVQ